MASIQNQRGDLVEVVRGCLATLLGETSAAAVDYFVESRMAIDDPDKYVQSMQEFFRHGSGLVVAEIENALTEAVGLPRTHWTSLQECVSCIVKSNRAIGGRKKTIPLAHVGWTSEPGPR